jgi:hypothetical protein
MSRRRSCAAVVAAWLLIGGGAADAYEVRTHGEITRWAFEQSERLQRYLQAGGIKATDTFDPGTATPLGQLRGFRNTGTPRDWMIEGAIREDDFKDRPGLEVFGCERALNPPSEIDRPTHHFFDVQRGGAGLTVPPVVSGLSAPDWALGRQGRGPEPTGNAYSLPDARAYQWRALTEPTRAARDRNTALLFRALGHVVHVLQDMAQPQHTRNDAHPTCESALVRALVGESSWFEDYTETRTLGGIFRARGEPSPSLRLDGYASPRLTSPQDFFTGSRGLADFSSRNFLSAGTNFGSVEAEGRPCRGLAEPPCNPSQYGERQQPFSIRSVTGTTVAGTVTLLLHSMQDPVTGATIPDVPVSTRSVWDQHLEARAFPPRFTLNTINYDAAADILLPRAVGYSAGLLDYFFRGQLGVSLRVYRQDDRLHAELTVVNETPGERMTGAFSLHYDRPDGTRVGLPLGTLELGPAGTPTATSEVLAISPLPTDVPASAWTLVFQGTLGAEAGAVAATRVGGTYSGLLFFQSVQGNGIDFVSAPPLDLVAGDPGFLAAVDGIDQWASFWPDIATVTTRFGYLTLAYRDPTLAGETMELTPLYGICGAEERISYVLWYDGYQGYRQVLYQDVPIGVEVVEFEPPQRLEDLFTYRYPSPPPVRRVVAVFAGVGQGVVPIPLGGGFIGMRLASAVPDPGFPEPRDLEGLPYGSRSAACVGTGSLTVP